MRGVTFKGNREAEIQEFPDPTPGRETPCCASARRGCPASTCTATGPGSRPCESLDFTGTPM